MLSDDRAAVVGLLEEALALMDAAGEQMAAIHVHQAIEILKSIPRD